MPPDAGSSQIRPPCASTIARAMARPRPAPAPVRARGVAAPEERLEHPRLRGGGDARAGVGDLDLQLLASGSASTITSPSAGVWRIALWSRLNSTRCRRSGSADTGERSSGTAAPHVDAAGLGLRAQGVDDLADEHGEAHPLRRPGDVAGLEPGQVEEIVDEAAQPAQVPVHALERDASLGVRDDLLAQGVGEQAQRGDRRAQIVRDRGQQRAAGLLLGGQAPGHRGRRAGHRAQLVGAAGDHAHVALPAAHGVQAVADRRHVAQHAARQGRRGRDGDHAREDGHHGQQQRVVPARGT